MPWVSFGYHEKTSTQDTRILEVARQILHVARHYPLPRRARLSKFHRSAINGVGNHAGGRTYHRLFGADVSGLSLRYHQVEDFKFEASLVHAYVTG